jgi:hypothetical protein
MNDRPPDTTKFLCLQKLPIPEARRQAVAHSAVDIAGTASWGDMLMKRQGLSMTT